MAVLININQDKRRNSNHLWYGRAWHPQIIDTRGLAQRIQANVSVKESDVYAVLIELAEVLGYEIGNGNKCLLDRFGYFYASVRSTGALTKKDWTITDNIKDCKVRFQQSYTRSPENAAQGKSSGLSSRALSDGFKFKVVDLAETETEDGDDDGE